MPHIELDPQLPGIRALFAYRPETAQPLGLLAETLLRGPNSLSVGERELIASVVSKGNDCTFCSSSHGAAAAAALDEDLEVVAAAWGDVDAAPVSAKVKALLRVALAVRETGKAVTPELVAAARAEGATDVEIHDTVLIAAAFCMYNRYVDGLATVAPPELSAYRGMGQQLVDQGYLRM
ncbi:carboxymuconolactone decarboxylase family protein [Amycolatopsis sp. 195334CR]|uniref:carboxymuconolactone decarboxylase family protein n=1 Tax=Amycolatopsis sp. 195334CR TaxID=2814588 RepID=UPI001A8F40DD|nr:carboxymuconolactone decarboxylase family protein [Amycolatopsis sp. 195334CR]MBN6037265.1 carboxymuconolactone decarboxylase family protein [Amycolatopsis sp. 195334CR]